jgi:TrmH family RNA methyltransferase
LDEAIMTPNVRFKMVIICSAYDQELHLEELTQVLFASEKEMQRITCLKNHANILAVVEIPEVKNLKMSRAICLDKLQDPGNMGTIMRIADWFGITDIVASNDTVDVFNPKTIQASMGSIFRVQVHYVDLTEFLKKSTLPIYAATMDGKPYHHIKFENNGLLLIGNEGNGISPEISEIITHSVGIPRIGKAESLNAAVACGILCAHWSIK